MDVSHSSMNIVFSPSMDVVFDYVVLALPWTLFSLVDIFFVNFISYISLGSLCLLLCFRVRHSKPIRGLSFLHRTAMVMCKVDQSDSLG